MNLNNSAYDEVYKREKNNFTCFLLCTESYYYHNIIHSSPNKNKTIWNIINVNTGRKIISRPLLVYK